MNNNLEINVHDIQTLIETLTHTHIHTITRLNY